MINFEEWTIAERAEKYLEWDLEKLTDYYLGNGKSLINLCEKEKSGLMSHLDEFLIRSLLELVPAIAYALATKNPDLIDPQITDCYKEYLPE